MDAKKLKGCEILKGCENVEGSEMVISVCVEDVYKIG